MKYTPPFHILCAAPQIPHLRTGDPELYARLEATMREHQLPLPAPGDAGMGGAGGAPGAELVGGLAGLGMVGAPGDAVVVPPSPSKAVGGGGPADMGSTGADIGQSFRNWGVPSGSAPGPQPHAAAPGAGVAGLGGEAVDVAPGGGPPGGAPGGGAGPVGGAPGGAVAPPSGVGALSMDAEMEENAGRVLADEVAASSLAPAPAGVGSKAPTLAPMVNTESLESAAEKADLKIRKPPENVQVGRGSWLPGLMGVARRAGALPPCCLVALAVFKEGAGGWALLQGVFQGLVELQGLHWGWVQPADCMPCATDATGPRALPDQQPERGQPGAAGSRGQGQGGQGWLVDRLVSPWWQRLDCWWGWG